MSEQYDSSAEFTEDLEIVLEHLDQAMQIMSKAKWDDWMHQTDNNYNTNMEERTAAMRGHLAKASLSLNGLFELD